MRLRIQSLGKIEHASIEIRPITLLVGENNTNKTWTAYAAYGLMKLLSFDPSRLDGPRLAARSGAFGRRIREHATIAAQRISQSPESAIVDSQFQRSALLAGLDGEIEASLRGPDLAQVLAAPEALLSGASAVLSLSRADLEKGAEFFFISSQRDKGYTAWGESDKPPHPELLPPGAMARPDFRRLVASKGLGRFTARYTTEEGPLTAIQITGLLRGFLASGFLEVVPLPAEREALVMLYKARADLSEAPFPLPLSDFLERMRLAEVAALRPKALLRPGGDGVPDSIYKYIRSVLGGEVVYRDAGAGQRLVFVTRDGTEMPIHIASSFVRSLAPLVIQPLARRSILIVDEPEMNAHPSAQLAVAEILAMLAKSGHYVFATTHSPYIVGHINNLLEASRIGGRRRKSAAKLFQLGLLEPFLTPDMVSAYEISPQGEVSDIVDREEGRVTTSTFGDVSSRLENLFSELLAMESA
jgi:hypothetical protein